MQTKTFVRTTKKGENIVYFFLFFARGSIGSLELVSSYNLYANI